MRFMPLRALPTQLTPTPPAETGKVLRDRVKSGTWPLPEASAMLHAIMTWPNDEERRQLFLDAGAAKALGFGDIGRGAGAGTADRSRAGDILTLAGRPINFGGLADAVINELENEIAAARFAWKNVADLMQTLARMHFDPRVQARGAASLSKAKDVVDASKRGANRQRLESDWSNFRDVAPLATATATLAAIAVNQTGDKSLGDPIYPIFFDPESVLCMASMFQQLGLTMIPHGRKEPILSPDTLWRLPSDVEIIPPPFDWGPLDDSSIDVLSSRKARRGQG